MADAETVYPTADRHDAELRLSAELERLPGVITAAVWLAESGRLRDARVHILPGAAPTIIANAVSGVLRALGISFDPALIRVTTVVLPNQVAIETRDGPPPGRLLLLHDLTLSRTGSHVSCRVQLMRDGNAAFGEAQELDTGAGRVRAAANATLRAAEQSAEGVALGVEGVTITSIFGRNYAVVSVEAAVGRRMATLNGIVAVDPARAPEEAVCLATLRAIDRWMAL